MRIVPVIVLALQYFGHLMMLHAQSPVAALSPVLDSATSKRIAERLVTQVARVRAGELVWLSGSEGDLPLLEDLAIVVQQVGAHPVIEYGSNRLTRRYFQDVPARLDTVGPQLRTLAIIDVWISIGFQDPQSLAGVDPARLATIQKASAPFQDALKSWKGRSIALGNGLYPTAGAAEEAGIPQAQLASLYRAGLDVDFVEMERTAAAVRAVLASGREIRLQAANGTDFRARLGGQPVHTNDGVISDEDAKGGIGQRSAYLPAGEVYVVLTPGTAHGTLVMDKTWFLNQPISGLRAEVQDGRVTRLSAERGGEALRSLYDRSTPGKDLVGVLDVGINPAVRAPAGSQLLPWSQSGLVTIAIGSNLWAGGDNTSGFGLPMQLADATLTVDGVVLVDKGRLVSTHFTGAAR